MVRGRTTAEKVSIRTWNYRRSYRIRERRGIIKKGDIVSVPLMLPVAAVKIVKTVWQVSV
jgi:hypothetical protein